MFSHQEGGKTLQQAMHPRLNYFRRPNQAITPRNPYSCSALLWQSSLCLVIGAFNLKIYDLYSPHSLLFGIPHRKFLSNKAMPSLSSWTTIGGAISDEKTSLKAHSRLTYQGQNPVLGIHDKPLSTNNSKGCLLGVEKYMAINLHAYQLYRYTNTIAHSHSTI